MKNILIIILLFITSHSMAQEGKIRTLKSNGKHFKAIEFNVRKNTFYAEIIPQFKGSSLTIEVEKSQDLQGSYILLGGTEKFIISKDAEQSETIQQIAERSENQSSGLYMSKEPFDFFSFYSGNLEGKIRVNILYAAPLKNTYLKDKKKSPVDCNIQPESIDQSIWRVGLPDPQPNPSYSAVKHIILHHAAGSNTDTQYTNTVRNYYLLHTQTNGWDDIGYNFLVAPNGDIYDGRQGDSLGDDNVIGAHMCARNTNTMGICLLGNYNVPNAVPSDTALGSINALVTWKLWKEQLLNPYDSSLHPVLNPVMYLGIIAGHREGCNPGYTECPGQNYFDIIEPKIKAVAAIQLANCMPNGIITSNKQEILIYPNPWNEGVLTIVAPEPIEEIKLLNALGQVVLEKEIVDNNYRIQITNEGLEKYNTLILMVKTGKGKYYSKVVTGD